MKRNSGLLRGAARRLAAARDPSGTAAVEFAFAAMPMFLFLFAIINAGYVLWLQNALDTSVTDAARCAAVNPSQCGTASQIKSYAAGRSGAGFDSSIFSFSQESSCKRVSATYPLSLTPPFAGYPLTLSAQACYPNYPS